MQRDERIIALNEQLLRQPHQPTPPKRGKGAGVHGSVSVDYGYVDDLKGQLGQAKVQIQDLKSQLLGSKNVQIEQTKALR